VNISVCSDQPDPVRVIRCDLRNETDQNGLFKTELELRPPRKDHHLQYETVIRCDEDMRNVRFRIPVLIAVTLVLSSV